MTVQDEETDYFIREVFCDVSYCEEVAQGFGHFFVINSDETIVQPISSECAAVCRFGLSDFVFMVRENQVFAASVDIECIAQVMFGHYGAFNVPAGSAFTPRGCPAGFAFFFGFPQNEVCRVFLRVIQRYTFGSTCDQFIQIFSGQFAVFREFFCIVVNGTLIFISKAFVDQSLYHCDDTIHFFCYTRVNSCSFYIQAVSIAESFFNVLVGDIGHCYAFFICSVDDFVIYVCEVLNVCYFIAFVFHITSYCIEYNVRSCVTDVDVIVYCGAANVHFYFAFLHRYEFFLLSCHCVI